MRFQKSLIGPTYVIAYQEMPLCGRRYYCV